jgi:DNA-binding transcriptional ArsR family regulator
MTPKENSEEEMPDYVKAASLQKSRKVLEILAKNGGIATFSQIEKESDVKGSVLNHHLNRLQQLKVIQKEVKGTYRLKYKTPLCLIYGSRQKIPITYFGLLGRKEGREEPEPKVALKLLEKENMKPDFAYVVTSPEALNDWKELKLPYQWILCYEEEIINIDAVKQKIKPQLLNILQNHTVIMDCTSATKPATIAYYELAQKLWIPIIYIYEETKQLKWLISKEAIQSKLTTSTAKMKV